jgi:hypothetical protein
MRILVLFSLNIILSYLTVASSQIENTTFLRSAAVACAGCQWQLMEVVTMYALQPYTDCRCPKPSAALRSLCLSYLTLLPKALKLHKRKEYMVVVALKLTSEVQFKICQLASTAIAEEWRRVVFSWYAALVTYYTVIWIIFIVIVNRSICTRDS